ncbi:MAG: hypothetical protein Ct9H300mP11_06100 [Chloroflexota bacterium]|nr:MAG: hypothetical protein Ct9H300mP11_06100 [Chloroflexota bacterium]
MSTQTISGSAQEVRQNIRSNAWRGITSGVAPGHVQANLAILPKEMAFDFLLFCQRNPKPCPLLEVIEPGQIEPVITAPGADIRTDASGYRIYENGELKAELDTIEAYWRDDLVSFLLGCSFSFETAMVDAGIPLRHQQTGNNVAMYITNHCYHSSRNVLRTYGRKHAAHQARPSGAGCTSDITVSSPHTAPRSTSVLLKT